MAGERIPHLSKKDREKILQRDNNTSSMRHYSEEKGFYFNQNCPYDGNPCDSLQAHHREPVRWGLFHHKTEAEINDPDNINIVFECEHTGHCRSGRVSEEYARKR